MTPLDVVTNALIQQILTYDSLKTRNVIDFADVKSNPAKGSVQTADLPEIALFIASFSSNVASNSSSINVSPVWRYMISTGTYNSKVSNELMMAVLSTVASWRETIQPLLWNEIQFVRNARLISAQQGMSNADQNRNITGWASIVDVEIDLYFTKDTPLITV
jgi:hypothetical protein